MSDYSRKQQQDDALKVIIGQYYDELAYTDDVLGALRYHAAASRMKILEFVKTLARSGGVRRTGR